MKQIELRGKLFGRIINRYGQIVEPITKSLRLFRGDSLGSKNIDRSRKFFGRTKNHYGQVLVPATKSLSRCQNIALETCPFGRTQNRYSLIVVQFRK